MRSTMRRVLCLSLLLLWLAPSRPTEAQQNNQESSAAPKASSLQSSSNAPASTNGQYAPNDVCQTCHQEVWDKHFYNTPHSALLKNGEHGCESCHGPAQAHVDGGGDITKIIRFETLSPAQTAAICLKCHQSSLETQNFSKSEHLANGITCTNCHSPHQSADVNFLLVKKQTRLVLRLPCPAEGRVCPALPPSRRCWLNSVQRLPQPSWNRKPVTRCARPPDNSPSAPSATPTPWVPLSSSMRR